ncbi:AraC family transcriptional regulator [Sphingobacteriaceae bacterium]|nr:AraC family transcriptional regulator [Sphingobacteriaceae bacterium]
MSGEVSKYDFKPGLSHEFEILDVTHLYKHHKDLLTTPHRANFYHIIWFESGSGTHLVDFEPIKLKSNSLLFIGKNKVQRFDPTGDYKAKAILFTDQFFCKSDNDVKFLRNTILFNDLFENNQIQLAKKETEFDALIKMMQIELRKNKDLFQQDFLRNLLHNFLLLAERSKRSQAFTEIKKGADLDYTLLFKDLLEAHFRVSKQVSFYAGELSVTEKRLNKATSKILGATPKQMIGDRVLLEAKRLLSHTDNSIKSIGFELGFDEPTNFIKYFRKHSHSTPIEFRERYLK